MATYTEYWVDYSADKRTGAQVAATTWNGFPITGAIRYIDAPNLLKTKHTNKTEYDSLLAAGLKVRLVMQDKTTDADGGYAAGVARAQRAKAGADYLGYSGVIFFTNDRTELPNPAVWQAYLDGAASVLGLARVGAYGFQNAMNAARGHASAFWQSGRESELVGHANYYQWNNGRVYIAGLEADLNKVVKDYTAGAQPAPATDDWEEDLMSLANGPATGDAWGVLHVPLNGRKYLRVATSYGAKATLNISLVDDTQPVGSNVKTVASLANLDADRPGPWDLSKTGGDLYANYSHVVIQYKADGPVTAWVNDRP